MNIKDYRDRHPKLESVKPDVQAQAQVIAREAVRMEFLTQDESWNQWLSFLQSYLSATMRLAKHFNDQLRDPMLVNVDELAKVRAALTMADCKIQLLNEIIAFPKMLLEEGEKAKKIVAEMARDSA